MRKVQPVPRAVKLSVLDATVVVTTDSSRLLDAIRARLGPFVGEAASSDAEAAEIEVRVNPHPPRLRVGDQVQELSGADPAEQAFSAIFRAIVDQVRGYLLVHAAALVDARGAILLAGSSGSGKTTLCLRLARRGLRILSDDFTPIDRSSGLVVPFPKAMGVRRGAGSSAALETAGATITGRRGLLAHDGLPATARAEGPAPLAGLIFLDVDDSPALDPAAPITLAVRCAGPRDDVRRRLSSLAGVDLLAERGDELTFRVDPRRASSARLEGELAELASATLEYGLVAPHPPRGDQAPVLRDISPTRAAILLLRELQNRRPGGRLLRSVDGDPTRLLPELGQAIANVPMARLEPGDPEQTALLVESTLRTWQSADG
jgi:hypothetical protein